MNKTQIRKFKNTREAWSRSYVWDDYEQEYEWQYTNPNIPAGSPHAPNKDEAKALRRIMAQTGLTEEQVRSHKKYRIELSNAQKHGRTSTGKISRNALDKKRALRYAARKLGLPVWHADVHAYYEEHLKPRPRW
jgi:hypothetical protein